MVGEIKGPPSQDETPIHAFLDLPNGQLSREAGNLLADGDRLLRTIRKMELRDQERLLNKVDQVFLPDYRSCSPFIFSNHPHTRRLIRPTRKTPSPWSVLETCAAP